MHLRGDRAHMAITVFAFYCGAIDIYVGQRCRILVCAHKGSAEIIYLCRSAYERPAGIAILIDLENGEFGASGGD